MDLKKEIIKACNSGSSGTKVANHPFVGVINRGTF